jgi:hypothetical protein
MKIPLINKTLPPFTSLLPFIVGLLCTGLFLICSLMLITPHLEPKQNRPNGNVTAVSANGLMGIREVLDASGAKTRLNRIDNGPRGPLADLVIINLDTDFAVYSKFNEEQSPKSPSSESDLSAQSSTPNTPETAQDPEAEDNARLKKEYEAARLYGEANSTSYVPNEKDFRPNEVDDYSRYYKTPNPEKSNQILYEPLGKAVLITAPKWETFKPTPKNARWATDPNIQNERDVFSQLTLLSPVRAKQIKGEVPETYSISYKKVPYIMTRGPQSPNKAQSYALTPAAGQSIITKGYSSGKITALQSISGPNLTPLLLGPNGEVLLSKVNPMPGDKPFKAPVYLLSDPDLINNQALSDPERVAGALSLIKAITADAKTPDIVFDITFNDFAYEQDIMHYISRPPFLGVPLAFLILGLVVVWAAFARFGPAFNPKTDIPHGRGVTILADNAARLMAKVGREPKLGPAYAQIVRDQVLRNLGYGVKTVRSPDELAELLSEKFATPDRYSKLFSDAQTLNGPSALLSWAQRLHNWKQAIIRPATAKKTET